MSKSSTSKAAPLDSIMVKRSKSLALIAIFVLVLAGLVLGIPYLARSSIKDVLASYGLSDVIITRLNLQGGEIMFSDIRLDEDGFSSIETIRASTHWPGLLTSNPLFSQIIIDNLVLTGEIKPTGALDIAGWQPSAAISMADVNTVILNGGQINLLTSAGGIRLELKGQAVPDTTGGRHIETILWGRQHQLSVDSRWDLSLGKDNSWEASGTIDEARVNLDILSLSRAQGWLNLGYNASSATRPVAGQLTAGQIVIGDKTSFTNAAVSFDGALENYQAIVNAQAARYEDVDFSADLQMNYGNIEQCRIVISAAESASLFAFLEDFRNDLQDVSSFGNSLTSLLITPGNISRIKKELSAIRYERLDLVIQGTAYDLTGKLIARQERNGTTKNVVISMNPGEQ